MHFPSRRDIDKIASAYPVESDRGLFLTRPRWVESGEASLADLGEVVGWKSPRTKQRFLQSHKNLSLDVPRLTRNVFALLAHEDLDCSDRCVTAAARGLCALDYVNTRTASALLAVCRPERFTVMDWRAWAVLARYGLLDNEVNLNRPESYVSYLRVCRSLAHESGASLRNIDRCLWVLGGTPEKCHSDYLNNRRDAVTNGRW
jgi:hypothetical protein